MAGLDRNRRHNSAGLTRTRSVNNEMGRFAIRSPSGTIIGESDEQPARPVTETLWRRKDRP